MCMPLCVFCVVKHFLPLSHVYGTAEWKWERKEVCEARIPCKLQERLHLILSPVKFPSVVSFLEFPAKSFCWWNLLLYFPDFLREDKNAMILSSHFPVYKKLGSYDTLKQQDRYFITSSSKTLLSVSSVDVTFDVNTSCIINISKDTHLHELVHDSNIHLISWYSLFSKLDFFSFLILIHHFFITSLLPSSHDGIWY